jgi:4-amino-4-deoxy-L-arabinose transferase-like glycosyltransferase
MRSATAKRRKPVTKTESAAKHDAGKYMKLYAILFIAFAVRIAVFLYYQANLEIRTFEYEEVAVNLIHGKGFVFEYLNIPYRAGIAPLFPALCAFIYLLFGHHQILIVLVQIALSTATCALVFFIAERFFDSRCAYLVALLTALHPGLIIYSSTMLHSHSLYSFLICLSVFLLRVSLESHGMRNKILLGLCTGLCVLERAAFLPFFVLGWFWLLYYSVDKKEAKRVIQVSIISLFVIVGPWVIRNTVILKQPVFIQTNQWAVLWIGNNSQSSGTAMIHSGKSWVDTIPDESLKKLNTLDEIAQMNWFKADALTFIRQYPGQFIERTLKKLYYFWWFSPQAGMSYPASYLILYRMYYTVILSGSLIGLIWALRIKKTRPLIILVLLLFSSNSLLHSLYYLEGRHRIAIEPLLLICFSFGVMQILQLRTMSKSKSKLLVGRVNGKGS